MLKSIVSLAAATALVAIAAASSDVYVIKGVTVHPVTGPNVENASVLISGGKIADIGGAKMVAPKTAKVIDGKGLHVFPGMINSATEVGMAEIASIRESADTNELGDFDPQLRAAIAMNPSSEHIPVTRANGITSVMVLPSSVGGGRGGGGATQMISGQAGLMHLDGWTWEEMAINKSAALEMKFPVIQTGGGRRNAEFAVMMGAATRTTFAESKRAFDKKVADMHDFFEQARHYQTAKKGNASGFKTDLRFEAMIPVLEGKIPVMLVASKGKTVKDAVAFADKEKIKIVIAGVDEMGDYADLLKQRNIPVIVGPTLELPNNEDDPYDQKATLPGELFKAGVKIAFATFDVQFARNLPYQAATAVAFGLPYEEALKAVTINAAEIWGVADRTGSVEKGKWADLIVTDGDPLETKTQIKYMFIKGHEVDLTSRHTKLFDKYMARPQ